MPMVTSHGRARLRQRTGVGAGGSKHYLKKVYKHGIRHRDTTGKLRKYISFVYHQHKAANDCRIYGDSIYLFHNANLITVFKLPDNILNTIKNNTKPEVYEQYVLYRQYRKQDCRRKKVSYV